MILEDYIFTGCYSNDIQGLIQQKNSRDIFMTVQNISLYSLISSV